MKKLLALVLALVMTLSLATVSSNAAFKDAKDINETYAEAAEVLAGMGVFKGYEEKDGTFSFNPKGDITRAEVAAIIYRIYTADVAKNDKSGLYATYNKFSDMAGAGWAAGYIGYCANAEFVKGYPDGTFKPLGKVTGYEVLAMILRAVGYDQKGEFTGAGWQLHVAQIAEQQGILDNVKGVDLNAAATRELVAELLFRAVQIPMVTYTAAFGYQNVALDTKADNKLFSKNVSLGYKNFGLIDGEDEDAWGRPVKVWAKDADKDGKFNAKKDTTAYAKIAYKADASFQAATAQCDILKELGTKKDVKGTLIVNGDKLEDAITLKDVTGKIGAQGRQIEVYYKYNGTDTRVVMIDTFLAYVDDTTEAKFDKNGHMTTPYTMTLYVYDEKNDSTKVVLEDTDAAFAYEEGDWVLVNAYTNKTNDASVSGTVINDKDQYVEVLQKAESFVGSQTKIWSNGKQHTIDKKTYDDAYKFLYNVAGDDDTQNFTWFLDQFGNLIGCDKVDNSNYAVLKEIKWTTEKGGQALATLVYMDGTESGAYEVVVNAVDKVADDENHTGAFAADKLYETEQADRNGDCWFESNVTKVSTSTKYNENYQGVALYRIEKNTDGSVDLVGFGGGRNAVVGYAKNVRFDKDASTIFVAGGKLTVTGNTQILVREKNDDGDYVYKTYSRSELPQYASFSAEIYYTTDANGFATRIYVKSAVAEKDLENHIFVISSKWGYVVSKQYAEMDVMVDGEVKTIRTTPDVAKELAKNVGKLYHADFKKVWNESDNSYDWKAYGFIEDVRLVNDYEDENRACDYIADYGDGKYPVLSADKTTLQSEQTWNLTKAAYVVYDTAKGEYVKLDEYQLTKNDLRDNGIWVIGDTETRPYDYATLVYVGTKLDGTDINRNEDDASLDIVFKTKNDAEPRTLTDDEKKFDAIVVEEKGTDKADTLYVKVNNKNTVVSWNDGADAAVAGDDLIVEIPVANKTDKVEFTVHNEAANYSQDYVIGFEWPEADPIEKTLTDAIVSITNNDTSDVMVANKTGYATLASALTNKSELSVGAASNVKVTIKADLEALTYANFKASATVTESVYNAERTEATLSESATVLDITSNGLNLLNGDTLVLKVWDKAADQTYFIAFNIVK